MPDIPHPEGAVTDRAGVLGPGDDDALERRIAAFRARTHYEIGVLILPTLVDSAIEDVAYEAFHRWGVGQKGADNGVLLVIATKERRTRIETGKGIGDRLTDLACARILDDDLRPHLKAGHFRAGIEAALGAIERNLDGAPASRSTPVATTTRDDPSDTAVVIIFVVLVAAVLASCALARPRRYAGFSGYASNSSNVSSYDSGSSSFSSGGGDFGGGGGGFGGGDSGGGGASGGY